VRETRSCSHAQLIRVRSRLHSTDNLLASDRRTALTIPRPLADPLMANLAPSLRTNDTLMADLSPKPPYERTIIRTPSPTPSEQFALSGEKRKKSDLFKKENWSTWNYISTRIPLMCPLRIAHCRWGHYHASRAIVRLQRPNCPCIEAGRKMDA
jgi:hypothetical protein